MTCEHASCLPSSITKSGSVMSVEVCWTAAAVELVQLCDLGDLG